MKNHYLTLSFCIFTTLVGCNTTQQDTTHSQVTTPPKKETNQKSAIDTALTEIPAFASLKTHEPETYKAIIQKFIKTKESGASDLELINLVRLETSQVINTRLPHASNSALIDYTTHTVANINMLADYSAEACHSYLFPSQESPFDPRKYFTKDQMQQSLTLMDVIIKTSKTTKKIPTENEVAPYAQPVFMKLYETHGEDVALLDNLHSSSTHKTKVCNIISDLYSNILELPREEASYVLRWMYGQDA